MPRLDSVNAGRPAIIGARRGRPVYSSIAKTPVGGRVPVEGVNVAGDDQADRRVHGGPDKAVYAYAWEDTALSGPPCTRRSAWSSPATFTPSTGTRPPTGVLAIEL